MIQVPSPPIEVPLYCLLFKYSFGEERTSICWESFFVPLLQRTEWLCNTVFTYPDICDKGTSLANEVTNSEIGPL